ncbi:unnamed protein product [Linum trigynum]|uniref:MATH domain-containing protein n=1 Tax=Linum trigynum TaxID=586398 RepID=A0AAV2DEJ7_9ROSI
MAVEDQKTNADKFTWRIENFSKLKATKLCSETFLAGGRKWSISIYPKGNGTIYLPVYLHSIELETMPDGKNVDADFTLTLVNQINAASSLRKCGKKKPFPLGGRGWGFPSFVMLSKLLNPDEGFIVNDTVTIEVRVSMEQFTDQPDSASRETMNPEQRSAADDHPSDMVLNSAAKGPATPLSIQVASPANLAETTESSHSSRSVRLTSRSLGAEISRLNSNMKSSGTDSTSILLQQQREAMIGFLTMSLEAIYHADSFGDVEEVALQLADHPTAAVDKTHLKGLLTELKKGVSGSMSVIETSHAVEASLMQMSEGMEARLVHRQKQLSCLEGEVMRLGQEEKKLEAEMWEIIARKARVSDQKKLTSDELESTSQEASRELEEVKEQSNKRKRASENRLIAQENLAQLNASWKVLKDTLGL